MTALRIHRWCNEYHLPRDLTGMQAVNGDLDRLTQGVADALAQHVGTLLADSQDELVLLPMLDVRLDLDLACPPAQLVRHWSRQVALGFARALDDPQSGIVRFPTRAAYHARFIGELLQGRAWDSWLFGGFDGLRVLAPSAIIRTLMAGDDGLEVLARIDAPAWPLLLAALATREAVRILAHWQRRADARADAWGLQAALAGWPRARLGMPATIAPPILALWLLAHAERNAAAAPSIGAACWLAVLLSLPGEIAPAQVDHIARAADLHSLARTPGFASLNGDSDWTALLAATPATLRKTVAKLAVTSRERERNDGAARDGGAEHCFAAPFGGLAWLLPALQDLFGADLPALLPPLVDCDAHDIAALAILAIATGSRSEYVWRDPFWRSFFRLPPRFDMDALQSWLAPHDAGEFDKALSLALQRRTLTDFVLLRFARAGKRREQAVERGSGCRLHPREVPAGLEFTPVPLAERLRLTRLLRRDADFLQAAGMLDAVPPRWRPSFETLAQATLRRTAWRIPGASCASLPYLFANVLNAQGQARSEATATGLAWSLELNRPPLHMLLSLNGMARQRLSWTGPRKLALHCTG
jgi:hypothetical protein